MNIDKEVLTEYINAHPEDSLAKIADSFGVSQWLIRTKIAEFKINYINKVGKLKLDPASLLTFVEENPALNQTAIAAHFGVNVTTIVTSFKRWNIPYKPKKHGTTGARVLTPSKRQKSSVLFRLRASKNLTVMEMAQLCGVHPSSYWDVESGRGVIGRNKWAALAQTVASSLGVPEEQLWSKHYARLCTEYEECAEHAHGTATPPDAIYEREEQANNLDAVMQHVLSSREIHCLQRYFGFGMPIATMKEISITLDCSESRISQIMQGALSKLRKIMCEGSHHRDPADILVAWEKERKEREEIKQKEQEEAIRNTLIVAEQRIKREKATEERSIVMAEQRVKREKVKKEKQMKDFVSAALRVKHCFQPALTKQEEYILRRHFGVGLVAEAQTCRTLKFALKKIYANLEVIPGNWESLERLTA